MPQGKANAQRAPANEADPLAPPTAAMLGPEAHAIGRLANAPAAIPWRGWKQVLRRTLAEMISDRMSLAAAGCAFWATLALFPAISTLISVYGLAFDPATVEPQLQVLARLLPPAAFSLIDARVQQLVSQPRGTLTFSLVLSFLVALYRATTGTKSILAALNLAYEESEVRSILRYQLTALGMTLCAVVAAVVGIGVLVLLPLALSFLDLPGNQKLLAQVASLAVLLVFVVLALSLLYRFGPSRRRAAWRWVTPGSLVATLLWLVASAAFSYYVGNWASYDATYGPLGAVAGVMMWFWVTVYAVLLGAELNSELELQTARDSTDGPPKPPGRRGAYVADHVAPE